MRHNGTGESAVFPCDDWLDNGKKGKLERYLLAGVGEEGRQPGEGQRRYKVTCNTSFKDYAGTDAPVWIQISGPKVRRCQLDPNLKASSFKF